MGVRAGVCLGEEVRGLVNYVWSTIKLRIGICVVHKLLKGLTYICTYSVHIILFGRRAKKGAFLHNRFPSSLQHANHKRVRSFDFKNRSERAITHLTFTELTKLLFVVSQISCYGHLHSFFHSPIHNEIAEFLDDPIGTRNNFNRGQSPPCKQDIKLKSRGLRAI